MDEVDRYIVAREHLRLARAELAQTPPPDGTVELLDSLIYDANFHIARIGLRERLAARHEREADLFKRLADS